MNSEALIDDLIRELRSGEGPFSVAQLAHLELAAKDRRQRESQRLIDGAYSKSQAKRVAAQLREPDAL